LTLEEAIKTIKPINSQACEAARNKWDNIGKPLRSLGRLEEMVIQLAGIQEKENPAVNKKAVLIFCADNGVVEEGITQTSSDVTAIVTENFTKGIASINSFSKVCEADVMPIDIGICKAMQVAGVMNRKVAYGTKNMAKEPAMTRAECIQAIEVGINLVTELKQKGYNLIMTGEMGIGNTTTSSAVLSVLENVPVKEVTGKGAGLSQAGIEHKIKIIQQAIDLNQPNPKDPIDVLQKVGGFDICGMAGAFIGGAVNRVPVLIDGFISAVAANCAIRIVKACEDYIFASHCSAEPAGQLALNAINKEAYINCGMCLGEGTGAVIGGKLFDFALAAYDEIASFDEAKFGHYELLN
jgi:nicotinate-nucleotide--dimethylbenzimidazole phosphoribosyltransferase